MSSVIALNGPAAGMAVSAPSLGASVCSSDAGGVAIICFYSCLCESCEFRETPCAVGFSARAKLCEPCEYQHRVSQIRRIRMGHFTWAHCCGHPHHAGDGCDDGDDHPLLLWSPGERVAEGKKGSFLARFQCGRRQRGIALPSDYKTRFAGFAVCTW